MDYVKEKLSLLLGVSASLIWGLSPAFTRMLGENWGYFTAGMIISIIGGIIALLYKQLTTGFSSLKSVSNKYWLICGTSYIVFIIASNLSVGLAISRTEVVTSGIFRLLWPLMTLITIIPIQKIKVKKQFYLAILLCLLGVLITNVNNPSISSLICHIFDSWKPCVLGLISSIAWGIYSNYYSRYVHNAEEDFVGLIMIATGLIQLIASYIIDPVPVIYFAQVEQLSLLVFSSFLGNIFWNFGMRGHYNLYVIIFANFIPVISTVFTGLILGVDITFMMLFGSLLIVIGTMWSKKSFII